MNWIEKIDPNLLAALLAAISAIISPMITAIINNRHQYRMRKLEMVQEEKIKAIQQYAEACSNYISYPNRTDLLEYSKAYGKIFLYAEKAHHKAIKEINRNIENKQYLEASETLSKVCAALSSEMKI